MRLEKYVVSARLVESICNYRNANGINRKEGFEQVSSGILEADVGSDSAVLYVSHRFVSQPQYKQQ